MWVKSGKKVVLKSGISWERWQKVVKLVRSGKCRLVKVVKSGKSEKKW